MKYTRKMHLCIQDYTNEFMVLNMLYSMGGISMVNDYMKKIQIKSFEKYLEEHKGQDGIITGEAYKNPLVQRKIKELNEFVIKLNTDGTTMRKDGFDKMIKRVLEIMYTPTF